MVEQASVLSFAQRHTEILQFTNFETSSPVQVVSLERFTSYKLFRVYIGGTVLVSFDMVALCNRADHYIFILFLLSSSFFCSPNLSGRKLDVYHTLAHGVALVRI